MFVRISTEFSLTVIRHGFVLDLVRICHGFVLYLEAIQTGGGRKPVIPGIDWGGIQTYFVQDLVIICHEFVQDLLSI